MEQTTDILFLLADLRKCSYFRREIERARAFLFLGKKIREIRKEKKKRRVIVHAPLKGPARCWGSPNGFQNPRGMSDMFWFSSRRSVNFEMRRCVLQKRALLFFYEVFFVSLSSSSFSDYKKFMSLSFSLSLSLSRFVSLSSDCTITTSSAAQRVTRL